MLHGGVGLGLEGTDSCREFSKQTALYKTQEKKHHGIIGKVETFTFRKFFSKKGS